MDYKKIDFDNNNIHITDSYEVSKYEFDDAFDYVEKIDDENGVLMHRSRFTLKMEWSTHNACYNMHLFRSHTKDVDLNYPQNWFITGLYVICGLVVYPFLN